MPELIQARARKDEVLARFEDLLKVTMIRQTTPNQQQKIIEHLAWMKAQSADIISNCQIATNEAKCETQFLIKISFPALVRAHS